MSVRMPPLRQRKYLNPPHFLKFPSIEIGGAR